MTRFLDAALEYAELGIRVFPCRDKKPLTDRGFHDASCDSTLIEMWWSRYPDAQIGAPADQWWVLDVDGDEGRRALSEIQNDRPLYTARVRTARGSHLYFQGAPVPKTRVGARPGLDIRAAGSYVILPPSLHTSGVAYAWEVPLDCIAETPDWLVHALEAGRTATIESPRVQGTPTFPLPPAERASIISALKTIDPDIDYQSWVSVGMALQSTDAGEEAFQIWDAWSKAGKKYKGQGDLRTHWRSFGKRDAEVTVASLFHMAKATGWTPAVPESPTASDSPLATLEWGITTREILDGSDPRKFILRRATRNGELASPGMGDPFLALGETACLAAEGGTGKTTVLFQLVASIATRRDWMDHFHVCHGHPSGVLVLLGEEDWRQVHESMHRVHRALQLTTDELSLIERMVRFLPLKSVIAPLVRWNGKKSTVEHTEHFDALVKRLQTPPEGSDGWGLIAIDPLSRFSAAGVEGDNERATQFWQHMERLPSEAPGSPSIVVAMHSSKEARRSSSVDARGVTSLTDSARHVLGLRNAEGGCVELQVQKMNYAPGWWNMMLRRGEGGLLFAESEADHRDRVSRSSTATPDELAERVPGIVRELGGRAKGRENIAELLGARIRTARVAVDLAVSRGLVLMEENGRERTYICLQRGGNGVAHD